LALWLDVDPRSGVPIYVQLVEGVRHALAVGTLEPGERLPTVRALAKELTIAPNTVVKAYNELQRMGLIESRPGIGTVAVGDTEGAVREQQVEALHERIRVLVRDAVGLGVTEDELWERLDGEFERVHRRARERTAGRE
jgi:GntR family transcriptional regulator